MSVCFPPLITDQVSGIFITPARLVLNCWEIGGLWEDLGSDVNVCAYVCTVCVSLCAGSLCVSLSVFYSCTEGRVLPLSPPPLFEHIPHLLP